MKSRNITFKLSNNYFPNNFVLIISEFALNSSLYQNFSSLKIKKHKKTCSRPLFYFQNNFVLIISEFALNSSLYQKFSSPKIKKHKKHVLDLCFIFKTILF